jgi:hypothetical protein
VNSPDSASVRFVHVHFECIVFALVNDNGDAKITKFSILPATGRQGTTFAIDFTYVSFNGTGTGELAIDIQTPDQIPLGNAFLWEAQKPGTYNERITIKAEPDPQCDPTQGKTHSIVRDRFITAHRSTLFR